MCSELSFVETILYRCMHIRAIYNHILHRRHHAGTRIAKKPGNITVLVSGKKRQEPEEQRWCRCT